MISCQTCVVRRRVVARIERGAARLERVRHGRSTVICQRAELRIAAQDIVALIDDHAADVGVGGGRVPGDDRVLNVGRTTGCAHASALTRGVVVRDGRVQEVHRSRGVVPDAAPVGGRRVARDSAVVDVDCTGGSSDAAAVIRAVPVERHPGEVQSAGAGVEHAAAIAAAN